VADIAAGDEAEITTNGSYLVDQKSANQSKDAPYLTWRRCQRVGGTEHDTASLDGVETFDHKSNDGSRCHVLNESREEGFVGEIGIVYIRNG
jgi:hypothetical protein